MGKKDKQRCNTESSIVLQQIYRELGLDEGILCNLNENERGQLIAQMISVERHHRGPLPAPSDLEGYSQTIPNGADRIMQMAEKQQAHRIQLEREVISRQLRQSSSGQIFAFTIAMTIVLSGVYCIIHDFQVSGTILSGLGLTGIVTAFIRGKNEQRKQLNGNAVE